MRKFTLLSIVAFVFVISFVACNNELDLIEDGADIPVIYALIKNSELDTAQYFRIERAFIDKETSALIIAQNPDSLYYPNANVVLTNKKRNESYTLTRVDGNEEGYVRDEGVFAQSPNYLYKIKNEDMNFDEGAEYEITLDRGGDFSLVTATTTLLNKLTISKPDVGGKLAFNDIQSLEFKYFTNDDIKSFDVQLFFNYVEVKNGVSVQKTAVWDMAKNIDKNEVKKNGIDFLGFVKSKIDEDPDAIRIFKNIDFKVTAAADEISDYINIVQANLGITSSQEVPKYSNLSEGYGVFSNIKESINSGISLTPITMDSLRDGRFTKNLNFQ